MDKETAKRIICQFIDNSDGVDNFNISNDYEEIDRSTLDEVNIIRIPTGKATVYLTVYKKE
jgi:hypothetical protein